MNRSKTRSFIGVYENFLKNTMFLIMLSLFGHASVSYSVSEDGYFQIKEVAGSIRTAKHYIFNLRKNIGVSNNNKIIKQDLNGFNKGLDPSTFRVDRDKIILLLDNNSMYPLLIGDIDTRNYNSVLPKNGKPQIGWKRGLVEGESIVLIDLKGLGKADVEITLDLDIKLVSQDDFIIYTSDMIPSVKRVSGFHIGNSLTWDSGPGALFYMAAHRGIELDVGWHIMGGSPLNLIVKNSSAFTRAQPNSWNISLKEKSWDYVTFQPYRSIIWGNDNKVYTSTLKSDEDAIVHFIGINKSPNTVFYIYAPPPSRDKLLKNWHDHVIDDDQTETKLAKRYFTLLMNRVRKRTKRRVYIIPTGEVIYQLLKTSPHLPYFSLDHIYRDNVHLSYHFGRFIASSVSYATIFKKNPREVWPPYKYFRFPDRQKGKNVGSIYAPENYSVAMYEKIFDMIERVLDIDSSNRT